MDELLIQYADKFHENFLIFIVGDKTESEIKSIIQKCLDEGKPYQIDTNEDCFY